MANKPKQSVCRMCGAVAHEQGGFCASCGASLNLKSPFAGPPKEPPVAVPFVAIPTAPTPTVGGSVKMGFGIALGMVLFLVLAVTVVVLVIGVATSRITWPFAEQGQRFEGVGPAESVPMALEGTYVVRWTAAPTSPSACRLDATLTPAGGDPPTPLRLLSLPIEPGPVEASGETTFSLAKADYRISVASGCRWSLRLLRP